MKFLCFVFLLAFFFIDPILAQEKKEEDPNPAAEEIAPEEPDDDKVPALGMKCFLITDDIRQAMIKNGLANPPLKAVIVASILHYSPAHVAGIKEIDIIEKIGTLRTPDEKGFKAACEKLAIGKPTTITVLRMERKPGPLNVLVLKRYTFKITPLSRKAVKAAAKRCPIVLVRAAVGTNRLGLPVATVVVRNISPQDVVAYTVSIHCFNRFDEPVRGYDGSAVVGGISQHTVAPGETFGDSNWWNLGERETTSKVKIVLTRVKMADGSEWEPADGEVVSIIGETED